MWWLVKYDDHYCLAFKNSPLRVLHPYGVEKRCFYICVKLTEGGAILTYSCSHKLIYPERIYDFLTIFQRI